MHAAKYSASLLHAMPDDTALAMWTSGRERVDRAFEAVEYVTFSAGDYLKRLVILIFAISHLAMVVVFRTRTLFAQAKACLERPEEIEILFEVAREQKFFARLERRDVTADHADAANLGGTCFRTSSITIRLTI